MTAMTYSEPIPIGPVASPNRMFNDLLAGMIMLAAFVGLSVFSQLSPYAATLIIGSGGLIAMAMAFHVKYRGRIAFDCETGFIIGATIQYLLAPVLIRVLTNNFDFDVAHQSAERYAIKDAYGPAMLIVLLFFAAYFFTSSLIPVKRPSRTLEGRLKTAFSTRTLLVMGVLCVMLWITRADLLASGSFYHIFRSDFQKEDPRYSAWVQFDSGIGPMLLAFLWGAMFVKRLPKWLVISYSLLDLGWNFASGGRERTITCFIVVILTFIVYRNRVPWRTLFISAIPIFFLIGFMDYYRYAIQQTANVNTIRLSSITEALSIASRESSSSGTENTLLRGIARFNDLESIAAIDLWTGTAQPFLEGETYARIPVALIPRQLWPDKPSTSMPINEWYFIHEGGSSPTTTMGEGYLNFGWPGVALAGFMAALLVRLADWFIVRYLWNIAVLPIYIGTVAIYARLHTQPIAIWIPTFIKMVFFTLLVHILTRPPKPTTEMEMSEVNLHPDVGAGMYV